MKEESTSSGTRKKKGSARGGRLTGMLESMQKRSSPVNAHKVATKYFDDFKKERQIPAEEPKDIDVTEEPTGKANAVITAIASAVMDAKGKPRVKKPARGKLPSSDPLLSRSENKVYIAMYEECLKRKTNTHRFGLKELKEKTGLSDKTIRVAIHSLEEKKNIRVEEPSLGIYGRKFRITPQDEVFKAREEAGLVIDPTTKKVLADTTAVDTPVNMPVDTTVATIETTVIDKEVAKKRR